MYAQTCYDQNGYVASKNQGGTTTYNIWPIGTSNSVAQTYHYDGVGQIYNIRVYGDNPSWFTHRVRVSIYNVDVNNRPTSMIYSTVRNWYASWNTYLDVSVPGVQVSDNFALVVQYNFGFPTQIQHTGNDGLGEDLTSYRTSSGGNWLSFGQGGDFYIIPFINNNNKAEFSMSDNCIPLNGTVNFTDMSEFVTSRMFNRITEPGYSGSETLYSWDFGGLGTSTQQNPSFTFNTAGVHTVTLTTTIDDWDGNPCQDTYQMQVSVGLDATATGIDLTCNNDESGEIDVTGIGGASPYTFSVNGAAYQSGTNFSGLDAGTYSISVMDNMGCEVLGATNVTLTEPEEMVLTEPVPTTLATCSNADGAMVLSSTGGDGNITYSLDNSSYQPSGSFTGLAGGVYTIYMMDDANGCIDSSYSVAINNTDAPSLSLFQYTTIACNGANTGSISVIGSGGVGSLQYSLDGVNWQGNGTFDNLPAGTYTPIVEDAAGCQGSFGSVSLGEPDAMIWSLSQVPTSCYGSSDGEINVSPVTGGTGTMSYSIDGVTFQSGNNFSGLAAGAYTVTVMDAAGCSSTAGITVGEPDPVVVTVDSWTHLSCFESGDGELDISATGGDGDYTFQLNNAGAQTNGEFYDLTAGTYSITVLDGNECMGTSSFTLVEPSEITSVIVTGNSTCGNPNGNILVTASGGSGGGYSYSLNAGLQVNSTGNFTGLAADEYGILITDGNGCQAEFDAIVTDSDGPAITGSNSTNISCNGGSDGTITITGVTGGTGTIEYSLNGASFQTSNTFTGLPAGTHIVVVRDANGCTGEVTVTLTEPAAFSISINTTDVSCYGGSNGTLTVIAGGGAGTLAYSVDGVNFQSSNLFDNLSEGTYTVTVKDVAGCEGTASAYIASPSQIQMTVGVLMVSCYGANDGAINAIATGGTGSIEFSLNGTNYQPLGYFNNLPGSTSYTVHARDANGCVTTTNVSVMEPAELALASSVSDVSCAGGDDGVIDLSITGGITPYSYEWSNLSTNEDIFNLSAGLYDVNVTDANGCMISENFTVTEPANPIIVNGIPSDATGAGNADGGVDITVTGGTAPYTYEWSNGATTEDLTGVLPGVYLVTITDVNGCTQTSSYTVSFTVGIDEVDAGSLSVYPNPARDVVTIELSTEQSVDRFVLIDPAGRIVLEQAPESNKFDVDVRPYAEGVYLINLQVGDNVIMKRIVINR